MGLYFYRRSLSAKVNLKNTTMTRLLMILLFYTSVSHGQSNQTIPMTLNPSQTSVCWLSSKLFDEGQNLPLEIPEFLIDPIITYVDMGEDRLHGAVSHMRGKAYLVVDLNFNDDLRDDPVLLFDTLSLQEGIPYQEGMQFPTVNKGVYPVNYTYFLDSTSVKVPTYVSLTIHSMYDAATDKLRYIDNFNLCYSGVLEGEATIDTTTFNFKIRDLLPWNSIYRVYVLNENTGVRSRINKGDEFYNDGTHSYFVDSLDFAYKKMIVKKNKPLNPDSLLQINLISTHDLSRANLGNIVAEKNTFVYFWGTWCIPCIRNIPKVLALKKKHKDIRFIGICVDYSVDKVVEFLKKNHLAGDNYYIEEQDFEANNLLNVQSFPTYLFISEVSEITKFMVGNKLEVADQFLSEL